MRQLIGNRGLWEPCHTHYSLQYSDKGGKGSLKLRVSHPKNCTSFKRTPQSKMSCAHIYSQLSRSFTARVFSSRDPTKGIRLISTRVTKLPQAQRYNKNTCLMLVERSYISSLRLAAVLRSGEAPENKDH